MLAAIILASVTIISGLSWFSMSRFNPVPQVIHSTVAPQQTEQFPAVDMASLDARQQKIVSLTRQEFQAQPAGTKYSEGVKEPWCADFVSWIMKQADAPLSNPNSGSWRIPGTYTLREYYQSAGKFHAAGTDYQPKIGDIMLYDNPNSFGQHTNIILEIQADAITTVGGNEGGSIHVRTHSAMREPGFVGYGAL